MVLGERVRMSENVVAKTGCEPLKLAILACETAGTGGKVMCHFGGVETPELMSQILDTLRPGDILTHAYSGAPNIAGRFTNIVQDGRLLPAALAAKQRGVVFDVGHGGGSFDYTVAEVAIPAGATPDTISSDVHVVSANTPGMPYLTWVMSKFLNMGYTLEQVVAMATINPAKIINRAAKLGTFQLGFLRRLGSRRRLIKGAVVDENRRLDFRDVFRLGRCTVERGNRRHIGAEQDGQVIGQRATEAKAGRGDFSVAVRTRFQPLRS